MAKKEEQKDTQIAAPAPQTGLPSLAGYGLAPSFMQQEGLDWGLSEVGKYIVPPRIKVVQPQSGPPITDQFNEADVVLVPMMHRVFEAPYANNKPNAEEMKSRAAFHVAPIFFYPEWAQWNDIKLKGQEPAIVERTLDPRSTIALKARDPKTREEKYKRGELELKYRFVEHLNFACLILGQPELDGMLVVLSFQRAEHRSGTNWNSLIKMRRAPLYGGQYECRLGFRTNPQGKWWGIDVMNPSRESGVDPFVQDEDTFNYRRDLFETLREAHAEQRLQVAYDEEEVVGTGTGTTSEEF